MAWAQTGNLKGPAGTIAVGTVTTGAAGSQAQIDNVGTSQSAILNFVIPQGEKGEDGADGKGIEIAGQFETYGQLPSDLTPSDAGKGYFVEADGDLYIWSGTAFPADGSGTAFQGPAGNAATVAVGTTSTGSAGTSASVSNSGTGSAAVLNFTIPKGEDGNDGAAASIGVGTVTTGAPGSSASVTNNGTSSSAVLDFTIPAGADGARGTKWFDGSGAPGTISGAAAGDYYLDNDSGTTYKLA